tara:strand:+ start:25041 stop:31004 length:5964 start_codon:yes stop_codon:yes gene_type:complete
MRLLSGGQHVRYDDSILNHIFTGVVRKSILEVKEEIVNISSDLTSISKDFDAYLPDGNEDSTSPSFQNSKIKAYGSYVKPTSATRLLTYPFTGIFKYNVIPSIFEACHGQSDVFTTNTEGRNYYNAFHPMGHFSPPYGEIISLSEKTEGCGCEKEVGSCATMTPLEYNQLHGLVSANINASDNLKPLNVHSSPIKSKLAAVNAPYQECPPDNPVAFYFKEVDFEFAGGTFAGGSVGNPYNHNPIPSSLDFTEMKLTSRYQIVQPEQKGPLRITGTDQTNKSEIINPANYGTGDLGGRDGINDDLALNNKLSYHGLCNAAALEGQMSAHMFKGGSLNELNYSPAGPLNAASDAPTFSYRDFEYWDFTFKENNDYLPFSTSFKPYGDGIIVPRVSSRGSQLLDANNADIDYWWENRQCPEVVDFLPWTYGATIYDCPRDYFEIPYYATKGRFGYYGTRFYATCKTPARTVSNDISGAGMTDPPDATGENLAPWIKYGIPTYEVPMPLDPLSASGEWGGAINVDKGGAITNHYFNGLLTIADREQKYYEWLASSKAIPFWVNHSLIKVDKDYIDIVNANPTWIHIYYSFKKQYDAALASVPNFLTSADNPYIAVDNASFEEDYDYYETAFIRGTITRLTDRFWNDFINESRKLLQPAWIVRLETLIENYGDFFRIDRDTINHAAYGEMIESREKKLRTRYLLNISQGNPIDLFPSNHIYFSFDNPEEYSLSKKWGRKEIGTVSTPSVNKGMDLPDVNRRYFEGTFAKEGGLNGLQEQVALLGDFGDSPLFLGNFYQNIHCGRDQPLRQFTKVDGDLSEFRDRENSTLFGNADGWLGVGYNEIGKIDNDFSCFSPIFVQNPKNTYCKLGQQPVMRALALDYHTIPEDKMEAKYPEVLYWAQQLKLLDTDQKLMYPVTYKWFRVPAGESYEKVMKGDYDVPSIEYASVECRPIGLQLRWDQDREFRLDGNLVHDGGDHPDDWEAYNRGRHWICDDNDLDDNDLDDNIVYETDPEGNDTCAEVELQKAEFIANYGVWDFHYDNKANGIHFTDPEGDNPNDYSIFTEWVPRASSDLPKEAYHKVLFATYPPIDLKTYDSFSGMVLLRAGEGSGPLGTLLVELSLGIRVPLNNLGSDAFAVGFGGTGMIGQSIDLSEHIDTTLLGIWQSFSIDLRWLLEEWGLNRNDEHFEYRQIDSIELYVGQVSPKDAFGADLMTLQRAVSFNFDILQFRGEDSWGCLEGDDGPDCTFVWPCECKGLNGGQGYVDSYPNSYMFLQGVKEEDASYIYFCMAQGRFGFRVSDPYFLEAETFTSVNVSHLNGGGAPIDIEVAFTANTFDGDVEIPFELLTDVSNQPYQGIQASEIPYEETLKKKRYIRAGGGQNVAVGFGGPWIYHASTRSYAPETIDDPRGLESTNHRPIEYGTLLEFRATLTDALGSALYGYNHLPTCRGGTMVDGNKGVKLSIKADGRDVIHPRVDDIAQIGLTNPPAPTRIPLSGYASKVPNIGHPGQLYGFYAGATSIGVTSTWQFHQNLGCIKRFGRDLDYKNDKDAFLFLEDISATNPDVAKDAFDYVKDVIITDTTLAGENCGFRRQSLGRNMLYFVEAFDRFYNSCDSKAKYNSPNPAFVAPGVRFGDAPFQYTWVGKPSDTYLKRQSMYGPYAFQWKVMRHNRDRLGNGISEGFYSMGWREKYSLMYDIPAIYGLYLKGDPNDQQKRDFKVLKALRDRAFPNEPFSGFSFLGRRGTRVEGYGYGDIRINCEDESGIKDTIREAKNGITITAGVGSLTAICAYYEYAQGTNFFEMSQYFCNLYNIGEGECFDPCLSMRYSHGFMPGGKLINHLSAGKKEGGSGPLVSYKITHQGRDVGPDGNIESLYLTNGALSDDYTIAESKDGAGDVVSKLQLRGPGNTRYARTIRNEEAAVIFPAGGLIGHPEFKPGKTPKSTRVEWGISPCEQGGSDHCNYLTPVVHVGKNHTPTAVVTAFHANVASISSLLS